MTQPSEDPGSHPEEGEQNRIPEDRVKAMVAKAKEEASDEAERRMQALLGEQQTQFRELEGKLNTLQQQKTERPPATRQELRQLVEDSRITQDHMDEELAKQQESRFEKFVETRVSEATTQSANNLAQQSLLGKYLERLPDLQVKGSETQVRLQNRYARLVADGMPATTATELLALELEHGKADKPQPKTRERRDVGEEAHGGGGGPSDDLDDEMTKAEATLKANFSAEQFAYAKKRIDLGQFKGFADPELQKEARTAARVRKAKRA